MAVLCDLLTERRWKNHPPQAKAGRECFADRSHVDDMIRVEGLQRAYRGPVIAKLGVVVVFDDDCICVSCPLDGCGTSFRSQLDAHRKLMSGSKHGSSDVEPVEQMSAGAVFVHLER